MNEEIILSIIVFVWAQVCYWLGVYVGRTGERRRLNNYERNSKTANSVHRGLHGDNTTTNVHR